MTTLEAIYIRRSRRTYLLEKIESEKIALLKTLTQQLNQESGLSMEIIEDASDAFNGFKKSYGILKGVHTALALIGKTDDPYLKEKCGYYGEQIVLEATKLGLGSCWVGGTFDKTSSLFKLNEDEIICCVVSIGLVPEETLREKIIHKLSTQKKTALDNLFESDSNIPEWFLDGIQAVDRAPSAVNKKPVRFTYSKNEVRAHVINDKAFELIDFGIAKFHFEVAAKGKFELGIHGKFTKAE